MLLLTEDRDKAKTSVLERPLILTIHVYGFVYMCQLMEAEGLHGGLLHGGILSHMR
jgi:hypothetical protein